MEIKNVVIVNDFNYTQGGASKVAIDTAKLLADKGIKVYFFSALNKTEEQIAGIEYITTNQVEALREKNKIKGIINGIYNFKTKKELQKLLEKLDKSTTIIHVHGWTKALSSSVFDIALKMQFKVVLTVHDYFTSCPNGGYFNYKKCEICHLKPMSFKCITCNCDSRNYFFKLYRILRQKIQNKILKNLKNKIFISDFSKRILDNNENLNDNITIIPNPIIIKNEKFKNVEEKDYYLFVGRVCKEKGAEIFCKEISNQEKKGIVIGDGPELKKLKTKYKKIIFKGWLNNKETINYIYNSDALIFPSLCYETLGLTVIEALILGKPCIVSENTAASQYINEKNGILFNPNKEGDLTKKLNNFKNFKPENLVESSCEIKQIFNNELYIDKLLKFYKK